MNNPYGIEIKKDKVSVLLVYPDYNAGDTALNNSGGNYQEGLASISAVIKEGGHDCKLFHMLYPHTEKEFKKKLLEFDADIVGFTVRTSAFEDVKKYSKWAKEAGAKFVYGGGYHALLVPDEVMAVDGMDGVSLGEGEYPTLDLCNRLKNDEEITDLTGFYFKLPDGTVIKNAVRPLIEDLDQLPLPDFELFDYKNLSTTKLDTILVMMSRGCLFSCTYCGNSQFRNIYPNKQKYCRFRSPDKAIAYLKRILEKYPNIRYVNFRDAIFNMYPEWFDKFIEMYTEEVGLPFTCNLRLDALTEDTVRRMADAGCYLIEVGVESGDEEIRKKYLHRYMTDEQMINAFHWFHKYHITGLAYNIIGLPYEDLSKALKTVKLNARLKSDKAIPNIFTPYPMTILADIAKEAGEVPKTIDASKRVFLIQKQFPAYQVLFVRDYFLFYINKYKKAFAMEEKRGERYEKWLDFWFLGPITPRRLMVFLYDAREWTWLHVKNMTRSVMPGIYKKLRDKKIANMKKKKMKSK